MLEDPRKTDEQRHRAVAMWEGSPWLEDLQLASFDALREFHHHWGTILWL